ncbi:MAG: outer membrane protein transport protein [Gammaproteobacteria bacterium]|nr:outer membrane protein transport protein [Gammaproteobacteria bacterium]
MKKTRFSHLTAFILAGALSGYAGTASAAGFAVNTPSAQSMGNATAGGGAVAEDASTVWFNPASMTRLPSQMMASAHVLLPNFEFTDKGSTLPIPPATPISGPTTSDGGTNAIAPNFYYIRTLNERWSFGLAVNAPFGLATEYDNNWKGRYHAIDSEIVDFNLNPALAYKVNEVFSVGAGVSVNYIDAKLTNVVDFATICAVNALPCAGPSGTLDGFAENNADDISFGFNFGVFYEPRDGTRFSLAYRSQINHKLEGDADFTVPAAALPFLGPVFTDGGIKVGASLPDTFSFSAFHMLTPKIGIMGDATWTGWSDIPELRIVYDSPTNGGGSGTSVESLGWEDVWRLALGLSYYHSDRLTLRTGVAYDQSPVPNPVLATPRLPDNDRIWVSIGASYAINDKASVDFAYTHEFIDDTNIARTNSTGATLNGVYESSVDIFSLQANYRFD